MSDIVKLNIGGMRFETTKSTLMRYPDSMLATMIQQPNEAQIIQEGKELFIDRNGKHFDCILDFLRIGSSMVLPTGNCDLRQWLMQEADFYQLPSLADFAKCNGAFKVGDLVKLHGDHALAYVDTVAYGGSAKKHMCWACDGSQANRRAVGIPWTEGFKPKHDMLIGRINNLTDSCAIVRIAKSCLHAVYEGMFMTDDDSYDFIHICTIDVFAFGLKF